MEVVSSSRNPMIKRLRLLQQSAGRKEQGRFLLEGTHLVEEAIAIGWPMSHLCYTERWSASNANKLKKVSASTEKICVTDHVMDCLTTTQTPDGVIGIAIEQARRPLSASQVRIGIAVDRMQNPDNLGALIRASVALGSDGIWVGDESVDCTNPKVLRASAGQWLRQPPRRVDLDAWLVECRSASVQVLGADTRGTSSFESILHTPTMFVLGNEGAGIHRSIRDRLDGLIAIPMMPNVESLNVGMAGAILLYEALRQRACERAGEHRQCSS